MATIAYYQKQVASAEARIEKFQKKIERIRKAEATGWEVNPYGYDASDLRRALSDLSDAEAALEKNRAALTAAEEKANSRNVPAILEFLEGWKRRAFEFYDADLRAACEAKAAVQRLGRQLRGLSYGSPEYRATEKSYQDLHKEYYEKLHGYYRELTPEERKMARNRYTRQVKVRDGEWEHIVHYLEPTYEESVARLRQDLNDEADRKYDFIIERTNAIVGQITDASGLTVGASAELNGIVIGTKGRAKVKTIGAGGYNIQCFHFRTLIKEA